MIRQERRPATALFADIHGFTGLAERLDPERVTEALELSLSTMASVIEEHGGYVDKTLGDGIMALFGAPFASSDHAAQAVRAGLALQEAVEALRPELAGLIGRGLRLRIGINSGTVIAGPMGRGEQQAYTAVGDAVNVASRLEEAASPGTVLVGEATFQQVADSFRWGSARTLRLRGKRSPVLVHRAIGSQPQADATVGQTLPAFVGRTAELRALRDGWTRARRGSLRLIMVTGEPGVGKSRLAAEFAASLARESPTRVIWAEIEEGAIRLGEGAPCAPSGGRAGTPQEVVEPSSDAQRASAPGDVLAESCRRCPTLLILEEPREPWHAARRHLAPLLRDLKHHPLLVLVLKSEGRLPWWRRLKRNRLHLDPLPERNAARLLRAVLGRAVSTRARRLVLARARGLPLYIVEIGRWLLENEAVEGRSGRRPVRTVGSDGGEVPDSLQSVLLGRIDRLDEATRDLLQHACVLGEGFSPSLLAAVAGLSRSPDHELRRLEEAQLLRCVRRPGQERRYAFTHLLIRDALYQAMLRSTAADIHRKAAEALLDLQSEDPELLESVAHHYRAAGDDERAASHYLLAAEQADRVHAAPKAQRLRGVASQLLGLASIWFVYGGACRPSLSRRYLSAAVQFAVSLALVTPISAFLMSRSAAPTQVTLGLPPELSTLSPATLVLPVVIGGIPFLAAGLLLAHLAAPSYLRARTTLKHLAGLVTGGWLAALLAVALTLALSGLALRFGLLPSTLSHLASVAIFRLLAGDTGFIAEILGATLLESAICNGWLHWEAIRLRRRILDTPADNRRTARAHSGLVVQQLMLVGAVSAVLSSMLFVLYLAGVLPGLKGRPPVASESLAAAASMLGFLALAALTRHGWKIRSTGFSSAARVTLGLEVPLVIALLLGTLGAVALRHEAVSVSDAMFGPGDPGALDRMAALFPNLSTIAYARAELNWFQGDEAEALAEFGRAIALDPSFPAAYAGRAAILVRRADYERAEQDATRVVDLRPEHPGGYATRAIARAALGKADLAAADLEAATRPLPRTTRGWDAYFMRCFALGESGRFTEAIADCERSLALNGRHLGTHELLSTYYFRLGHYQSALETLNRMIAVAPGDALTWANRGAVHRELGDYDQALTDLAHALGLDPMLAAAYRERALTWLVIDRPTAAMADASMASTIDPDSAASLYTLGYVGTYSEEYELVIDSMDQALSQRPDAAFFNMRGYAYALLGDHEQALQDLGQALRLDPASPYVYDSRAVANLRAGSLQSALADIGRALELLPPSDTSSRAEFLYHLALVNEAMDHDAAATSSLLEASGLGALPAVSHQIDNALARLTAGR